MEAEIEDYKGDGAPEKEGIEEGKLHEEIVVNLFRASGLLTRVAPRLFSPFGITLQQYNILRVLNQHRDSGLPLNEIGKKAFVTGANITGMIDRLERYGLAARVKPKKDRRVILARITAKGLKLIETIEPLKDKLNAEVFEGFAFDEKRELLRLSHKMVKEFGKRAKNETQD